MKIGIIRADRMGDMILTLPVIQSLKVANSNSQVHVFCSNKNVKIINYFKFIDKIINIDENNDLAKEKYDLILNFSPGWRSFKLCLNLKSSLKGNLILTSRYNNNFYSKFLIKILSKIFFNQTLVFKRKKEFEESKLIHQTETMFKLLDKFEFPFNRILEVSKYLPNNRTLKSKNKICLIHLSSKWINQFYNEKKFKELILLIEKQYSLILTTDESSHNKFNIIFDNFLTISNKDFKNITEISETTIFENLNFENWTQAIYSSNFVITPECGCTHIAAICKVPSRIIYDPRNSPEMINSEYSPLGKNYKKFTFSDKNLNFLITNSLQ